MWGHLEGDHHSLLIETGTGTRARLSAPEGHALVPVSILKKRMIHELAFLFLFELILMTIRVIRSNKEKEPWLVGMRWP